MGKDWEYIRWWEYGEKEEVMNPPGGRLDGRWEDGGEIEGTNAVRSRGRRMTGLCKTGSPTQLVAYRYSKKPHPGVHFDIDRLSNIDFWCVE